MQTEHLSEAKDQLSALVEDVQFTHEAVTITRHGRPAAVWMAVDDVDSLEETLFRLSQPGMRQDLAQAQSADMGGCRHCPLGPRGSRGAVTARWRSREPGG